MYLLFIILLSKLIRKFRRRRRLVESYEEPTQESKEGGDKSVTTMKNIYDQPLQSCGTSSMKPGSWDSEGYCSETDGGVHQICVKKIAQSTPGFSKTTGQSNWSDNRGTDNHCVCLGAWSLYNAEQNKNNHSQSNKQVLQCGAIPKVALSEQYVSKFSEGWNKWNGLELDNQIKNGVEALVTNCYDSTEPKTEALRKNYCEFASKVAPLSSSTMYHEYCSKPLK